MPTFYTNLCPNERIWTHKYISIIQYIFWITHISTKMHKMAAFLNNCFMHFLHRSEAQNTSKPFLEPNIMLLYFYLEYFLGMKNMIMANLETLTDIGKNCQNSFNWRFGPENGIFDYTFPRLKLTAFLWRFVSNHLFGFWLFVKQTFAQKIGFHISIDCANFLVQIFLNGIAIRRKI